MFFRPSLWCGTPLLQCSIISLQGKSGQSEQRETPGLLAAHCATSHRLNAMLERPSCRQPSQVTCSTGTLSCSLSRCRILSAFFRSISCLTRYTLQAPQYIPQTEARCSPSIVVSPFSCQLHSRKLTLIISSCQSACQGSGTGSGLVGQYLLSDRVFGKPVLIALPWVL